MGRRVVVAGAGFGGLELTAILSERFGDEVEITLIDRAEGFVFGFAKLDVMFGRATHEAVLSRYDRLTKPGVRFRRETITAIDPEARKVTTDAGEYEGDALVIALGAAYDFDATPGLREGGNEFYSVEGARELADLIPRFTEGHALIGVCGAPFKCPPAPSECALLLHDDLVERGVRDACRITFVLPLPRPVPPSPESSDALLEAFAARGIEFIPGRRIAAIDPARSTARLDDGAELPFDLFLGVPKHRAPDVVIESGIAEDGYIPVDPATLRTRIDGVYAVGDVTTAGVPKSGVFAESAARVVAAELIAEWTGGPPAERYLGQGSCYVEFGHGMVARVDIDALSGPEWQSVFRPPSADLATDKERFGASRRERWFGSA